MELEYIEDFAIKNEDKYISIHQVKSGKENSLSNAYIFNFAMVYFEQKPERGYYHVMGDVDIPKHQIDTVKQYLSIIKNHLEELSQCSDFSSFNEYIKNLTDNELKVLGCPNRNPITEKTLIYGKSKKGTLRKFLYNHFKKLEAENILSNKNLDSITYISKEMIKHINEIELRINANNTSDIILKYEDEFNNKQDINKKISDLIQEILLQLDLQSNTGEDYLELIYDSLCSFLHDKIYDAKETHTSIEIKFTDLIKVTQKDFTDILNDPNLIFRLYRESFIEKWINFPRQLIQGQQICEYDACDSCLEALSTCNAYKQIEKLFSNKSFDKFMINLMLFKPRDKKDIYEFPEEEKLTHMVFNILKDIDNFEIINNILIAVANGKTYRITAKGTEDIYKLSESINKYFNDIEFSRETNVLVTKGINEEYLIWNKENIFTPNGEVIKSLEKYTNIKEIEDNILCTQKIRVINDKKVREELL